MVVGRTRLYTLDASRVQISKSNVKQHELSVVIFSKFMVNNGYLSHFGTSVF